MSTHHLRCLFQSPTRFLPGLIAFTILIALVGPSWAQAEQAVSAADTAAATLEEATEISLADHEIIDRILDLRRQIQDLREQLSAASLTRLDEELPDQEIERPVAVGSADTESSAVTLPESVTALDPAPQPSPQPAAEAAAGPADDGCNTLRLLDTNDDGVVSGGDRFWRYLRLWIDGNRDGIVQESEALHPFDFGIIEISGRLSVFHTSKKGAGDIRREDRLYFEPLGKKRETGILMVDATRIQRGNGLTLLTADLEVLDGLQAFRAGLSLRDADGETLRLNCP